MYPNAGGKVPRNVQRLKDQLCEAYRQAHHVLTIRATPELRQWWADRDSLSDFLEASRNGGYPDANLPGRLAELSALIDRAERQYGIDPAQVEHLEACFEGDMQILEQTGKLPLWDPGMNPYVQRQHHQAPLQHQPSRPPHYGGPGPQGPYDQPPWEQPLPPPHAQYSPWPQAAPTAPLQAPPQHQPPFVGNGYPGGGHDYPTPPPTSWRGNQPTPWPGNDPGWGPEETTQVVPRPRRPPRQKPVPLGGSSRPKITWNTRRILITIGVVVGVPLLIYGAATGSGHGSRSPTAGTSSPPASSATSSSHAQATTWLNPPGMALTRKAVAEACQDPKVKSSPNEINFACAPGTRRVLVAFAAMTSGFNPNFTAGNRVGLEPIDSSTGQGIATSMGLSPYDPKNPVDSVKVLARALNSYAGGFGGQAVVPGLESDPQNCQRYTGSSVLKPQVAGHPAICASPLKNPDGMNALVEDLYLKWVAKPKSDPATSAQNAAILFQYMNQSPPGPEVEQALGWLRIHPQLLSAR